MNIWPQVCNTIWILYTSTVD